MNKLILSNYLIYIDDAHGLYIFSSTTRVSVADELIIGSRFWCTPISNRHSAGRPHHPKGSELITAEDVRCFSLHCVSIVDMSDVGILVVYSNIYLKDIALE